MRPSRAGAEARVDDDGTEPLAVHGRRRRDVGRVAEQREAGAASGGVFRGVGDGAWARHCGEDEDKEEEGAKAAGATLREPHIRSASFATATVALATIYARKLAICSSGFA